LARISFDFECRESSGFDNPDVSCIWNTGASPC
jgi:hypothetical protein